MVWMPVAKVFVEATEYTGDTLANVSITFGKRDLSEQFRASYATVNLLSDGAGFNFDLNQRCAIYLQDSAATDQKLFTGRIMDIRTRMLAPDLVETSLSLLSPIARLGRRLIGQNGYPHLQDGELIEAMLIEAGNVTWDEAGGTWASQDPASTWNLYEGLFNSIDVGNFELHSYSGDPDYATNMIAKAELSGQGHLWEDTNGLINYQESDARQADVTLNGYEAISSDDVILDGTQSELSTAFTTNYVQVITGHDNIVTDSDPTSIQLHGKIYESFDTWLHSNAEAATWASTYLGRYAYPQQVLSSFLIPLSQVSTGLRDILIGLRAGLPVSISGLPAALGSNPYEGFVEGWQWRIETGEVFVSLNVSEKTLSL
jgi:hypothetical protein